MHVVSRGTRTPIHDGRYREKCLITACHFRFWNLSDVKPLTSFRRGARWWAESR
jgi:hypothetical protein